jgi:DNA-binding transcriptional MerR regulator|tara:strand:- start:10819 stop:11250 length:432 start_codon:yes stop_codon:yes gene_type:complete
MQDGIPIGRAAKVSGIKVPTIRYYEQIGLLPAVGRSQSNRRRYDSTDIDRMKFIRHSRELGFDIEAIRALLQLQDDPARPCADADMIARERLAEVRNKIKNLTLLEAELLRMVEEGSHGRIATCRVIETLADHAQCSYHGTDG